MTVTSSPSALCSCISASGKCCVPLLWRGYEHIKLLEGLSDMGCPIVGAGGWHPVSPTSTSRMNWRGREENIIM